MDVFERRRAEKALKERVKSGKSKGATIFRDGKSVEKLGSDRYQNITQEVRTSGEVVTTTRNSKGKVISRDVVKPSGKTIKPKTLAEQKRLLDEQAKTKMLRARVVDTRTGRIIDAGNFKLDKNFDRRYRAFQRANAQNKNRIINNARQALISSGTPKGIINTFTNDQLLKIAASQNISSPKTLAGKLKIIDNRKDLTKLQKETAKRKLLGLSSGVGRDKSFTKTIKDNRDKKIKQIRNSLNTITPGDSKLRLSTRYLDNVEQKLSQIYNRITSKPVEQRTKKEMILVGGTGITAVALGTINRVPNVVWRNLEVFVKPVEFAKGIYSIITDSSVRKQLRNTLSDRANAAKRGDISAIADIAAEIVGAKVGNAIISESGKAASISQPVRRFKEAKFVLSQPKEIRPYVKSILKSARIQEKLKPVDLKGIKKINFNEVMELNKVEAKALKKTLQDTDSVIFGSLPARTLSKGKTKIPKDVDLATKNVKKFQEEFIKNLPKSQRSKYKIGKESIRKGNAKILDIKDYARLRPSQTIFGTGRLPINTIVYETSKPRLKQTGLKIPTQKLVNVEGIKLVGFGEQTTRKALGTLQVILEKGARRAKDPASFVESLKIQKAALQGKIPKKNIVSKYLIKRDVKSLENAIKLLESKQFSKLLEKQVPGITKEFPIITKVSKLSKSKKKSINKKVKDRIKKIKDKQTKGKATKSKRTKSKTPKSKIPKSRVPKSRVPKSRVPKSRVPKSKIPKSRVPKSRVPKSRVPKSKIPKSRVPSNIRPSIIPPSKVPSNIRPSIIPLSKVPSIIKNSKIPASRIPSIIPIGSAIITPTKKYLIRGGFNNLKTNQVAKFEGVYRERKDRRKAYNPRTNPRVIKKIRLTTTKNRLLKDLTKLVDTRTARSMKVKLIGVTNKVKKDIKKPKRLKKFTAKIGKNPKVLNLVEKKKYLIDTKGEKRELKRARRAKKSSKNRSKGVSAMKGKKKASTNKKTFKTKKSAEKYLKKGQSVYKVKGGWRRTSL